MSMALNQKGKKPMASPKMSYSNQMRNKQDEDRRNWLENLVNRVGLFVSQKRAIS
jgi:hypothetical protein